MWSFGNCGQERKETWRLDASSIRTWCAFPRRLLVSMGTNCCCCEDTHNRRIILTQMSEAPLWTGTGPASSRTDMNLGLGHPTLLHTQGTHQDVGERSPSPILPRLDDLVSVSVTRVTMGRLQTLLLSHKVMPPGHVQGHPGGWPWGSHPMAVRLPRLPLPSIQIQTSFCTPQPHFLLYPLPLLAYFSAAPVLCCFVFVLIFFFL